MPIAKGWKADDDSENWWWRGSTGQFTNKPDKHKAAGAKGNRGHDVACEHPRNAVFAITLPTL